MVKQYDVVIVGAGPAGLECARALMGSRLSVLIIEKNEQIGPKTCAGGIVETVEPLHLPELKTRSFNWLNLYIKEKRFQFTSKVPIRIIDRDVLGHYQENSVTGIWSGQTVPHQLLEDICI
jgi:flavin-dependent dehydrogenase